MGKGIDIDEGLLETECIEEREEVVEELDMYEKSLHTQDVLQVGGSKQDAENFAIELLAMRLVCNFGRQVWLCVFFARQTSLVVSLKCNATGSQYKLFCC